MDLEVLERAPEAGDAEAVDGLVVGFVARAERFAQRAVSARAAGDGLASASAGKWASAFVERSTRLASGLDDAAGGCRQVAQVLAGYGAALRGLKQRVMVARHEVSTARIRAVAARERYAAAALAGGVMLQPSPWPSPQNSPAVASAAEELRAWQVAVEDVAAALQAFRACCDERVDLDRAVAARLVGIDVVTRYAPGTGVDVVLDVPLVQALTSAAAGTVTAEQAQVMAVWLEDAVEAVLREPQDSDAVRLLSAFLDDHGADPVVASALFASLGGERTVRLIAALGRGVTLGADTESVTLASLGNRIRTDLAGASRSWSQSQAERFADGVFGLESSDDLRGVPDAATVIGYLFADPGGARMSAVLTVAVADRIDVWEREHGRWSQDGQPVGYALAAAAAPGSDPVHVLDPAAAVLATLGTYSQQARDWLTGESVDWSSDRPVFDRARLTYWFGRRDWTGPVSDGFGGLGGLWAGVQSALGGVDARQVASINDVAFSALASNPAILRTEGISDVGSARLGQALAAQLPGLIELGVIRGPEDDSRRWELVPTLLAADGAITAAVRREELALVLAAATSQPTGCEQISEALLEYEAMALNAASSGAASPSLALDRLAAVWGVADGAVNGALEAEHQRASDQLRAAVGLVASPVAVPLALVPHPVVAIGLDVAADHIEAQAVRLLTPEERAAVFVRLPGENPLKQYFTEASATFRHSELWDGPELRDDAEVLLTARTDGATLLQRYQDTSGNMQRAIVDAANGVGAGSEESSRS